MTDRLAKKIIKSLKSAPKKILQVRACQHDWWQDDSDWIRTMGLSRKICRNCRTSVISKSKVE